MKESSIYIKSDVLAAEDAITTLQSPCSNEDAQKAIDELIGFVKRIKIFLALLDEAEEQLIKKEGKYGVASSETDS